MGLFDGPHGLLITAGVAMARMAAWWLHVCMIELRLLLVMRHGHSTAFNSFRLSGYPNSTETSTIARFSDCGDLCGRCIGTMLPSWKHEETIGLRYRSSGSFGSMRQRPVRRPLGVFHDSTVALFAGQSRQEKMREVPSSRDGTIAFPL